MKEQDTKEQTEAQRALDLLQAELAEQGEPTINDDRLAELLEMIDEGLRVQAEHSEDPDAEVDDAYLLDVATDALNDLEAEEAFRKLTR